MATLQVLPSSITNVPELGDVSAPQGFLDLFPNPSLQLAPKILIVEEERHISRQQEIYLASATVEKYGFTVGDILVSSSISGGLELLEANPDVSIVLCDGLFVDGNGFTVAAKVRALSAETGRHIPIIMQSASGMLLEEALLGNFCDKVLHKPFNPLEMMATIANLLPTICGDTPDGAADGPR